MGATSTLATPTTYSTPSQTTHLTRLAQPQAEAHIVNIVRRQVVEDVSALRVWRDEGFRMVPSDAATGTHSRRGITEQGMAAAAPAGEPERHARPKRTGFGRNAETEKREVSLMDEEQDS